MAWGGTPQEPQQPAMTPVEALADWERKSNALAEAKAAEAEARDRVFKLAFPDPREGTNSRDLANGYVLKGTHKIARKFSVPEGFQGPHPEKDATILDAVEHLAKQLSLASNEGAFVAERLIKYEAKLSDGEYKKLPAELRAIVDRFVTSSIGAPTLKIEPPKGK